MSENIPAQITIGGTISKEDAKNLIPLINDEMLTFEWGDYQEVTLEDLYDEVDGKSVLTLCNDSSYGFFEDLEKYLVTHKIEFNRYSDAHYEFNGEICEYRSYMESPQVFFATQEGIKTVSYDAVNSIRRNIQSNTITDVEEVKDILEILGDEVENLKPFNII